MTYEYYCENCGKEFDEVRTMEERNDPIDCLVCGSSDTHRTFRSGCNVFVFEPMWYEHIAEDPIYIESKRQLKEECDKRGVRAKRLD